MNPGDNLDAALRSPARAGRQWRAYLRALRTLRDKGKQTPCAGRPEWTSDQQEDVATALTGCSLCPIYKECRAVGVYYAEPGVWGGLYRPERN